MEMLRLSDAATEGVSSTKRPLWRGRCAQRGRWHLARLPAPEKSLLKKFINKVSWAPHKTY